MYPSVHTAMSTEMYFLLHREGTRFKKSSPFWFGCFFFWQKVGLLIHHIQLHMKKQFLAVHLQHPFLFPPGAPALRIHPFPFVCQTNACKSNFDLKVNWEQFIREIYREENWRALLIQRCLNGTSEGSQEGVCVLIDSVLSTELKKELA